VLKYEQKGEGNFPGRKTKKTKNTYEISEEEKTMANEVFDLVVRGKAKLVGAAVQEALDNGADPNELLASMIGAMDEVGEKFKNNEIFVPEMLVSARAMKKGVDVLKPHLASGAAGALGKVIIGTVAGDLHDIGKNLVAMMIESAGFEVNDLGVDVPKEKFVEALEAAPDTKIVCCSALLTTTMPAMRETVELLNSHPLRSQFKVMVGGAPITQEFANEIGADAYTEDAASCAQKAKALVS
jgi:corrinoid protein of di/trimethylamine methyltransferase